MEKETINNIFEFIKKNNNKNKPLRWKLINNEPLTDDELNIEGNLNLTDSKITQLPKGLKVGDNLNLLGSIITSLPEGLEVGATLDLSYSDIRTLPEGLEVGGSLWLIGCWLITSLPKGLHVGGDLYIFRTNFTNLSDDEIRDMIKPGFIGGEIYRT
jgi:hypothetical protein